MSAKVLGFSLGLATAVAAQDLLRFENGDTLHGQLEAISPSGSVIWQRSDIGEPIEFSQAELKEIVLSAGRPELTSESPAMVRLRNGDTLPCRLGEMDDETLKVETPVTSSLSVALSNIAQVQPQPFGGRMIYQGPYSEDRWSILPLEKEQAEKVETDEPLWALIGGAWYSNSMATLKGDLDLPDRFRLQFKLGWRNRLQVSLLLSTDYKTEARKEVPADAAQNILKDTTRPSDLPLRFGSGLQCNLFGASADLIKIGFDDQSAPIMKRLSRSNLSMHFADSGESTFDFRIDRARSSVLLFVDGEFGFEWSGEAGDLPATGPFFSLFSLSAHSRVRLSDVILTDWHGNPDGARSLALPDRDTVLMTNGTDRFAGSVLGITDGSLTLNTPYATLDLPLAEVAEINLGQGDLLRKQAPGERRAQLHFRPYGRVTGELSGSSSGSFSLNSDALGELDISRAHVAVIKFGEENQFPTWEDNF